MDRPAALAEARELARKYALLNAYAHGGRAQAKAVLGKLLAEAPQLRPMAKELLPLVEEVVAEVNEMPLEAQGAELRLRWPELLAGREAAEEVAKGLPPLPEAEEGKVVTRFSPNPDCALHLGSARAAVLSHEYASMYRGEFCLRFEDTDPRTKRPLYREEVREGVVADAYQMIREDLEWLGCRWSREVIQSDRLEIYYEYARKLLEGGGGYVCTCEPERFRQLALAGEPCPCRGLSPEEQLQRFDWMLEGRYAEGEAVVRVKTDLSHPNPAIREWPALRVVDTSKCPHPRVGDRYRVWPLYNFACAIDDRLMGITHIIRGKEHMANEERQRYLYCFFGWRYPVAIHYGRLGIEGGELSKSQIIKGIRSGEYSGFDDVRLPTLAALRRRGIQPEAIRRLMLDVGVKPADVTISWENLYSYNRKLIDPVAKRFFFVEEPAELTISGLADGEYVAELPLHPNRPEMGRRRLVVRARGGEARVLISKRDAESARPGSVLRLIGLFNVRVEAISASSVRASFHSESLREARAAGAPLIHYVPEGGGVGATVLSPDGDINGVAEAACAELRPGELVQFERFGFARIEGVREGRLVACFAHR